MNGVETMSVLLAAIAGIAVAALALSIGNWWKERNERR
jgi:hypothetical protein